MITIDPAVGKVDFVTGDGSATPTPTATLLSCSWSIGRDLPSVGARLVGVFFPANFHHARTLSPGGFAALPGGAVSPQGKFFAMGGRSADTPGSDFTYPFEFDPGPDRWTTKAATYPDNQVSNMACGVLNVNGADYIYCVGGVATMAAPGTARTFVTATSRLLTTQ